MTLTITEEESGKSDDTDNYWMTLTIIEERSKSDDTDNYWRREE